MLQCQQNASTTGARSQYSKEDVVSNLLDCSIVLSEFELKSRYYVHFRTNTLG